ncbi:MAG TPA: AAA family ATPase [Actinomycetota bacterium]
MSASIVVLDHGEHLATAVARALPEHAASVAACHQTAQAVTLLGGDAIRVLIAGPSMVTAGGVRFLQSAHEARPDVVIVLVAPKDSPVDDRELFRIGASDLVRHPASARALKTAVTRALELSRTMSGARAATPVARAAGTAITVTSPSGGCGKTFFATNLAYALARSTGKRVAIVDLDLQFGEVVTALRLRPQYTISDVLDGRADAGDEMRAELRDFMVRHPSGVEVLAAPKDPQEADRVTSPDITEILQIAKELYHYVIVDTPAALTEPVLAAFDQSEALAVMATLDVPSVRNLGVFLQTLERLRIPADGVSLILNKAERDVGLSTAEVQRLFPQGFKGILPYSKEVSRSINTGRLVMESSPTCDISRELATAIARLVPGEPAIAGGLPGGPAGEPATNGHRRGFFRRLIPTH